MEANRKATVTQMADLYKHGGQKSTSEQRTMGNGSRKPHRQERESSGTSQSTT